MKKYWKLLEAWVTGSKNDVFKSARMRLTVFYIAIITTVLVVFSVVLYFFLSQILTANASDGSLDPSDPGDLIIIQTIDHMRVDIIVLDVITVVLVSGLSYSLAGKTLKPIRRVLEKQKEFSANASHELRTPLAIMKTDCEVALKNFQASPREMKGVIKSNLEEVNRISQITENLLKISRIESEKEDVFLSKISLAQLAGNVVAKINSLATSRGVAVNIRQNDAGQILGNDEYLQSMVFNLIQNGINYNKPGGWVRVSVKNNKKNMQLIIKDNGSGISQDDLPHIFERFYKADKSHGQNFSGAGIGLSIVSEIVEKHKGTIQIDSAPEKGTRIIVALPVIST